jgi:hypothetical protein
VSAPVSFSAACAIVAAQLASEGSDLFIAPDGWQAADAWIVGAYAQDLSRAPGARLFVVSAVSGRVEAEWAPPGPSTAEQLASMRRVRAARS